MRHSDSQWGVFAPRSIAAFVIALTGVFLGLLSVGASPLRFAHGLPVTAAGTVSTVPAWNIVGSPNLTDQDFTGVTCVSGSDCWAVGSYTDASFTLHTLAEHWNGTTWSIVSSPNNGAGDNFLNAVVCTSTSNCWAVGAYSAAAAQQTLIEQWNGTSWSIVSSPDSSTMLQNYLNAVTCSSPSNCWAVGFRQGANNTPNQTLIEQWNGISWSIISSANQVVSGQSAPNELNAVTCTSTTNCWAVGDFDTGTSAQQQTLIEKWNGSAWAIVTSANATTSHSNVLSGVVCAASTDCEAVGYYDAGTAFQTLVERWNGTSWVVVGSPNADTSQDNVLNAVTCTSTANCWAAGRHVTTVFGNDIDQTLVERWNGSTWSIVSSPNSDTTQPNELSAVTCAAVSDCQAVGSQTPILPTVSPFVTIGQTLVEHWTGSAWSIVGSENIGVSDTPIAQILNAIGCSGPNDCWAVGTYDPGTGIDQTLIEHWDGAIWTIVNSPNTGVSQPNFLNGVSCTSSSNCWTSGYYQASGTQHTLTQHWDGTSWTIVPSPNTDPNAKNLLNGITCTSANQCWAVGGANNGTASQTLVEQWNGVNWSIVMSPNTSSGLDNQFNAITCTSAADCWAVGAASNGSVTQTFTAHWNGSNWSAVPSPSTSAAQFNFLSGVACVSSSTCWAAGSYLQGSIAQTLILKWNGAAWSIVSSPNTNNPDSNNLFGVACISGFDCSAVGSSGSPAQTLVNRWNGVVWSILASPDNSPTEANSLNGITCIPGADCWAIGSETSTISGVSQTLILKRTAPLLGTTAVSRPITGPSTGHLIITGKAVANSTVNVYATQNLANGFAFLNTAMADANGNFQYDDASAVSLNPPRRCYQVAYP